MTYIHYCMCPYRWTCWLFIGTHTTGWHPNGVALKWGGTQMGWHQKKCYPSTMPKRVHVGLDYLVGLFQSEWMPKIQYQRYISKSDGIELHHSLFVGIWVDGDCLSIFPEDWTHCMTYSFMLTDWYSEWVWLNLTCCCQLWRITMTGWNRYGGMFSWDIPSPSMPSLQRLIYPSLLTDFLADNAELLKNLSDYIEKVKATCIWDTFYLTENWHLWRQLVIRASRQSDRVYQLTPCYRFMNEMLLLQNHSF